MKKIAVVGCGAVGSYYGAKLGHSGQDMHFLLRSDYDAVRREGVPIRASEGEIHYRPKCARTPEEIGISDLVLVALKTTANDQYEKLLKPLVGPTTAILTLQNGLGNESQLASLFGSEKVLGGLCFVSLNRVAPGVIQHVAHAAILMGEYQRSSEPRSHEIARAFRDAGIPCKVTNNLEAAHWEKLVWNVPFNGLGVAGAVGYEAVVNGELPAGARVGPCLTSDQLLDQGRWEELVRELMMEVITTANALNLGLAVEIAEQQIARTRDMGAYKASTLLDFENGQRLELEALFLEPLRQAQLAGVSTPRLAAMCQVLKALDPKQ